MLTSLMYGMDKFIYRWYGLCPTGNQAGVVFQQAGRNLILSHPIGAHILLNDSFIDDLNSGALTKEQLEQGITEVKEILNHIGMDTPNMWHPVEKHHLQKLLRVEYL